MSELLRHCNRFVSDIRLFMYHNRLSCVLTYLFTHNRPVINPPDRLQVDDSSRCIHILKMNEIILSCLRVKPCALMRSINLCISLNKHIFVLIRSPYILRAHYHLPARLNSACRSHYIIIAVPLVQLRTFYSGLSVLIAVKHMLSLVKKCRTVRLHLGQMKYALKTDTALGKC